MERNRAAPRGKLDHGAPNVCGVYYLTCLANGRVYVGSTIRLNKRLSMHFRLLRSGKSHSSEMQGDFSRYGEDAFAVTWSECDFLELRSSERKAIESIAASTDIYNRARIKTAKDSRQYTNKAVRGFSLPPDLLQWLDDESRKEKRSASNYLSMLVQRAKESTRHPG